MFPVQKLPKTVASEPQSDAKVEAEVETNTAKAKVKNTKVLKKNQLV